MNWKSIVIIIAGVILALLGILWFLQGSDIVHLKPILCFADCQPIVGKSLEWQRAGAIAFIAGAILAGLGVFIENSIKHNKGKR